ncbi:MAG: HAD-IA family hydrolase [Lachnospiraceae bacterium]|nr:HAD-IA family hydrolase [Lachnospiraceae bacterium]
MNNIKCVIFDLDDTLYSEMEYVKQAFMNVAVYLSEKYNISSEILYDKMQELLDKNGRGKIFNDIIEEYNIQESPKELVKIYRATMPELKLYGDARQCIKMLKNKNIKLAIITDGCSQVQHNKIKGLGIEDIMDCIIVTDDYENAAKPSTIPYNMVMEMLSINDPMACIYIGDNPKKDFIGAREVGMHTARIVRNEGMFMALQADEGYEAEVVVNSLEKIIYK